jgi:hypothetical protein
LPSWSLDTTGFPPWWVRLPLGLPTMGMATHGARSLLGPAPPWKNPRVFPPNFAPNRGWHSCSFTNLAFPQHSCSLGPSPHACCSRGFAPQASSLVHLPPPDIQKPYLCPCWAYSIMD